MQNLEPRDWKNEKSNQINGDPRFIVAGLAFFYAHIDKSLYIYMTGISGDGKLYSDRSSAGRERLFLRHFLPGESSEWN